MSDLKKIWLDHIPIQLLMLLAVSLWVIISQQGEINRDGVLYLTEAQAILNRDWQQDQSLDLSQVYINDARTAFYADTTRSKIQLEKAVSTHAFPFLLIRYNDKKEIKKWAGYVAMQHFPSTEKPKLIFYKKIKHD